MSSNIEEVTSGADKAKIALAILAVVAGIAAYYYFAKQPALARFGMVLAGIVLGGVIALLSGPGQRLVAFLKDSVAETKRVTWPSRKEAVQMTLIVFAFSVFAAIILWLIDLALEWVIYRVLLNWK